MSVECFLNRRHPLAEQRAQAIPCYFWPPSSTPHLVRPLLRRDRPLSASLQRWGRSINLDDSSSNMRRHAALEADSRVFKRHWNWYSRRRIRMTLLAVALTDCIKWLSSAYPQRLLTSTVFQKSSSAVVGPFGSFGGSKRSFRTLDCLNRSLGVLESFKVRFVLNSFALRTSVR